MLNDSRSPVFIAAPSSSVATLKGAITVTAATGKMIWLTKYAALRSSKMVVSQRG